MIWYEGIYIMAIHCEGLDTEVNLKQTCFCLVGYNHQPWT